MTTMTSYIHCVCYSLCTGRHCEVKVKKIKDETSSIFIHCSHHPLPSAYVPAASSLKPGVVPNCPKVSERKGASRASLIRETFELDIRNNYNDEDYIPSPFKWNRTTFMSPNPGQRIRSSLDAENTYRDQNRLRCCLANTWGW